MIDYIAKQWIVWSLSGGTAAAIIYLIAYNHRIVKRQGKLIAKRDALLTMLTSKTERIVHDNTSANRASNLPVH